VLTTKHPNKLIISTPDSLRILLPHHQVEYNSHGIIGPAKVQILAEIAGFSSNFALRVTRHAIERGGIVGADVSELTLWPNILAMVSSSHGKALRPLEWL